MTDDELERMRAKGAEIAGGVPVAELDDVTKQLADAEWVHRLVAAYLIRTLTGNIDPERAAVALIRLLSAAYCRGRTAGRAETQALRA
jgi:hypothetical protein